MKTIFKERTKLLALLLSFALIFGLFCSLFGFYVASADTSKNAFVGISGDNAVSNSVLYSDTNTYNYNGENNFEKDSYSFRKYDYYDVSAGGVNGNIVSAESPQITVLTHGLSGAASNWSNNGNSFSYQNYSLISKLESELLPEQGAYVYWAKMCDHDSFYLVDLKNEDNINSDGTYRITETTDKITDISKHIIIIFESFSASNYNNVVYEEFNYMLSKIVYDVKILNGGELPRINLIGHSRGGITNLQYTLDHPDLVAGLYSIGTPYFGSNTAETEIGVSIAGNSNGLKDIIDENIYGHYYQRWSSNETIYGNIKTLALGGFSTFNYLCDLLKDNLNMLPNEITISSEQVELLRGITNTFLPSVAKWIAIQAKPSAEEILEVIFEDIHIERSSDGGNAFLNNLLAAHLFLPETRIYTNDVLVNLTSQLGYGEQNEDYGFDRFSKCFSESSGRLSNPSMPAVVHNLEAQDSDLISQIINNIEIGVYDAKFLYNVNTDGTAEIYGYRGASAENDQLIIPSEIDGLTVTKIEDYAFTNLSMREDIKTIVIPSSVKEIGNMAFSDCANIISISFSSNSQLNKIGEFCFSGCENLSVIALPSGVQSIGSGAFYGCTSLSGTFVLPASLTDLGVGVFIQCDALTGFAISFVNQDYVTAEGILYSKGIDKLIAYPTGKQSNSFTLPSTVETIGAYAFYGNESLTSVDLSNAKILQEFAVAMCSNLGVIQADDMEIIYASALTGTLWLDNNNNFATLGKVLYRYMGTNSELDLSGYFSVSPFALLDNTSVETVTFNNAARTIGAYAFLGCKNLNSVYLNNLNNMIYVGTGSFNETADNLNIYMPQRVLHEYESNELWQQYVEKFTVHSTAINFVLGGGNVDGQTSYMGNVQYGGYLTLPEPEREGYKFDGWYNSENFSGDPILNDALWARYDDSVSMYAKWSLEIPKYTITYHANGGRLDYYSQTYTEEDSVIYPIPERDGYEFKGWYHDEQLNLYAGTYCPSGSKEDLDLYAKWERLYNIEYVDGYTNDNLTSFTAEILPINLKNPTRNGYRFMGWYSSTNFNNDNKVEKIIEAKDITLYAYWEKLYTISFNSNGGSSVSSFTGIKGEQFILPTSYKDGYDGSWGDYEFGDSFTVTGSMTLTAVWTGKYYTITFDNNGGSGGTISAQVQYYGSMPDIELPTRAGHKLDYFYDEYDNQYYLNGEYESNAYIFTRNITLTAQWSEAFLIIENLGWDGGWKIRVTNTSSTKVTVDYNTLMCNFGDAQKWTGLNDIAHFDLDPGASKTLKGEDVIKENWFATSVAFSYVAGNYRYITYADGLYSDGRINDRNNRVLN